MQLKSLFFLALAALSAAELDERAPTKAECCCCYGGPSVGCAADLDCSDITTSVCFDTLCPFR
ncbi:hypothetical protein CGRA01v4_07417 [Colletotrichum graminicola]|uniref:Uncharacterized protein n=1 Tax=Colletotrichum graminicola (strain M1.001 / M2 / FGSC 10212) TaxID=645133 RepID=E3QC43_COLGM|nr:uncharacterized protein GLRG_03575 [Colletotrichum graminicola M1.001]EFQ28431.1 hypothetical protein GLRG_03575 [Colletotrichum graminicola M1.001]WDK16136.1 hypothetical protein CGRA01v4_07417 [Colletotrichum graminicola]